MEYALERVSKECKIRSPTFRDTTQEMFVRQFGGALSQGDHAGFNAYSFQLGTVELIRTPGKLVVIDIS